MIFNTGRRFVVRAMTTSVFRPAPGPPDAQSDTDESRPVGEAHPRNTARPGHGASRVVKRVGVVELAGSGVGGVAKLVGSRNSGHGARQGPEAGEVAGFRGIAELVGSRS
nr:hypothetical protein GCM10020092_003160 [Actinoplanes digitatis]